MTTNSDIAELTPLLSHWGIDARKPLELKPIPGGLSGARIWCVSHEGQKFCLRRWPTNHPNPAQLHTIHQVIEHVWQTGLKIVPRPHKTSTGDTFLSSDSHLWELSQWLSGEPLSSRNSTPQQCRAAIEALAKFHQVAATLSTADCKLAPGLITRRDLLAELSQGRLDELSQAVRDEPPTAMRETLRQLLTRIEHALPEAIATVEHCAKFPLPMQWCLRDIHPGNVLFQGDQVTGIVDFGALALDSVAGDIARLVGNLPCRRENRQEYLRIYTRFRPLTDDEQRAIKAYLVGGLILSAANWIRWIFIQRSVPLTNTTQARLDELLDQFNKQMSWKVEGI